MTHPHPEQPPAQQPPAQQPPAPQPPPGAPPTPLRLPPPSPSTGPGSRSTPGLYRAMRRDHGPVVPVELPGGVPAWLVVGYRELHRVTSDGELFPRDVGLWNQWPHIPDDWPLLPMVGRPLPSIYFTAGEEHRRHVRMVVPALEGADPFEIRGHCEQLADRLVDAVCGRGTADLVADFCEPLPVLVLARLVGFPDAEGEDIAEVLKDLADGGPGAHRAHQRFGAHMARLVADRRAAPGDDVTSRMLAFPEPFTDEEYALDLMAVTAAGHLTTADWLGNSLRLMLTEDAFADSMAGGRRSVSETTTEVLWEDAPPRSSPDAGPYGTPGSAGSTSGRGHAAARSRRRQHRPADPSGNAERARRQRRPPGLQPRRVPLPLPRPGDRRDHRPHRHRGPPRPAARPRTRRPRRGARPAALRLPARHHLAPRPVHPRSYDRRPLVTCPHAAAAQAAARNVGTVVIDPMVQDLDGETAKLREAGPLARIDLLGVPAWAVTRHADARRLLVDPGS